jgi:hypothetical protein
MRVYYGADADMNLIKSKTAAIIGFGSQGHAHALNLCDSGVRKVVVGLRPSSVGVAKAKAAGLEVVDAAEAAKVADVVMVLTPDELQGDLSRQKLHANMKPGAALAFAHGLNVHFNLLTPRPVSTCSWLRQRPQATLAQRRPRRHRDRSRDTDTANNHAPQCMCRRRTSFGRLCLFVKCCGEPRRADVLRDR